MMLAWMRTVEIKEKEWKTECFKEKFLKYPDALKEIHLELINKYCVTFIGENEFSHVVALLKYVSGDSTIYTLIIRGTKEEINDIQKDPVVAKSMFS